MTDTRADTTAYFCKVCGYSPTNRASWCDLGCGRDYNEMIGVPQRHLDGLLADAAAAEHDLSMERSMNASYAQANAEHQARVAALEAEVAKTDSANDFIADRCVELAHRVVALETSLRGIREQATRHQRATSESEYLLRDLEFITDKTDAALAASAPAEATT